MALIPPFFLDCVVAIGRRASEDLVSWSASGFIYGHHVATEEGRSSYGIYLVTNRHVFDGEQSSVLRFNPAGSDPAREFDMSLLNGDGERLWLAHPDDEVDLAVAPISGEALDRENIQWNFFRSHQHVLDRLAANEKGISEGDGVFMLGFPMGIVGGERNHVIVRQGAIARIRDWLAGATKDFLVDAAVFPGNSGGPVVSRPEATAIEGTKAQTAAYLLGVVTGYLPYRDSAISMQTGRTRVVFEENSGLASVVPVDYVNEVVAAHRESLGPPPTTETEAVAPEQTPREQEPDTKPSPKRAGKSRQRKRPAQAGELDARRRKRLKSKQ